MRVILCRRLGRLWRKKGGGYYNAAKLYVKYLQEIPEIELESMSVRDPQDLQGLKAPDLLWVFGFPTDSSPFIEAAKGWGCPVLINSEYNGSLRRNKRILKWWAKKKSDREVFLSVFSNSAFYNPALVHLRPRIVTIPHPFAQHQDTRPGFDDRTGICVGDIGKLSEKHRTSVDPVGVIERLDAKGIPVIGYNQYRVYRELPSELTTVPYLHGGFLKSLAGYRLFLNFVRHETFGMVPMEAMSAGTPTLYPHMPQSLSEYIGPAGLCYRNADDIIRLAEDFYHDPVLWEGMSKAGRLTARANQHLVGPLLLRAFRQVCEEYKKPCDTPTG